MCYCILQNSLLKKNTKSLCRENSVFCPQQAEKKNWRRSLCRENSVFCPPQAENVFEKASQKMDQTRKAWQKLECAMQEMGEREVLDPRYLVSEAQVEAENTLKRGEDAGIEAEKALSEVPVLAKIICSFPKILGVFRRVHVRGPPVPRDNSAKNAKYFGNRGDGGGSKVPPNTSTGVQSWEIGTLHHEVWRTCSIKCLPLLFV